MHKKSSDELYKIFKAMDVPDFESCNWFVPDTPELLNWSYQIYDIAYYALHRDEEIKKKEIQKRIDDIEKINRTNSVRQFVALTDAEILILIEPHYRWLAKQFIFVDKNIKIRFMANGQMQVDY
jgi:hypothetical protein